MYIPVRRVISSDLADGDKLRENVIYVHDSGFVSRQRWWLSPGRRSVYSGAGTLGRSLRSMSQRRIVVDLRPSSDGSQPELAPGEGPVLRLYLTVPGSAETGSSVPISFDGYNAYVPLFAGSELSYEPVTAPGSVTVVSCCQGIRGDVNGDGTDLDIVDLTCLVGRLFSASCQFPCPDEADVNGNGQVGNIVDVAFAIDWLFGISPELVSCQ